MGRMLGMLLCIASLWAGSVCAQNARMTEVDPIGTYSNIHCSDNSGDLAGMEVHIIPAYEGYYAVVEYDTPGPTIPFVVRALVQGDKIEFDILSDSRKVDKFVGVITPRGIKGKFESGDTDPVTNKKVFLLKKGKSYWQR